MNIINVIVCHGNFVSICYSFGSSGDDVLKAKEQFRICARKFLDAHEEAIQKSFDDYSNAFLSKGKISVNLVCNCNCD